MKKKKIAICEKKSMHMTHHPARVWLHCLQLLKLLDFTLIHVILQLPGAVLVRQRAPLHQVVHHLLQQHARESQRCDKDSSEAMQLFFFFFLNANKGCKGAH